MAQNKAIKDASWIPIAARYRRELSVKKTNHRPFMKLPSKIRKRWIRRAKEAYMRGEINLDNKEI